MEYPSYTLGNQSSKSVFSLAEVRGYSFNLGFFISCCILSCPPTGASQIVTSTLEFLCASSSSPTENDIGYYITGLISIKFIKHIFGPHGQIPRNKIIPELKPTHTYESVPRQKLGLILERRVDRKYKR